MQSLQPASSGDRIAIHVLQQLMIEEKYRQAILWGRYLFGLKCIYLSE